MNETQKGDATKKKPKTKNEKHLVKNSKTYIGKNKVADVPGKNMNNMY